MYVKNIPNLFGSIHYWDIPFTQNRFKYLNANVTYFIINNNFYYFYK